MHDMETVSRLKQTRHTQCRYVWWVWADKSVVTVFVTCSHWRGRSMSGLYSCSHQRGRLFMIHVSNSLDDFCLWALCIRIHHYGHWRGRSMTHEWHPCSRWRGRQVIIHVSTSLTSVIEHYGLNSVWPVVATLRRNRITWPVPNSRVHWWSRSCSHWITSVG